MSLENSPLPIYLVGDGHLSSFLKPLLKQSFMTFGRHEKDVLFDLDNLHQFTPPEKKGIVIYMIPPRENALNGLEKLRPIADSIIFISSTSVLGQSGRFDEHSPTYPETKNGRLLQQCEEFIQQSFNEWAIIRPGGLIDHQRTPLKWFSSESVINDCNSLINFIHTEDVARFIYWLLQTPQSKKIFHLTTNESHTKKDFYGDLFSHFNLAPPKFKEGKIREVIASEIAKTDFRLKYPTTLDFLKSKTVK